MYICRWLPVRNGKNYIVKLQKARLWLKRNKELQKRRKKDGREEWKK